MPHDAATSPERTQLAREAALAVAARLGVGAQQAAVLADWNNTVVRLSPAAIVAKVGTSHFRDARLESLERELTVSAYLAVRGAPVIPPARHVPPGPHRSRGLTVTLWTYVQPLAGVAAPAETAAAIKRVHAALNDFDGSLPDFDVELDDARRLLHPERTRSLPTVDRRFLVSEVDALEETLATPAASWRPLHGSPHRANWLLSESGPLLLDFETACRGPVEWDLAALNDDALGFFPDADRELVSTLRRMRSVCVAVKCWVAPQRSPQLREAAEVHLKLLRGHALD